MVSASLWVGLVLPGMIEEPSSFDGRINSPSPERGPEPSRRMSLAILNSAAAAAVMAPATNGYAVLGCAGRSGSATALSTQAPACCSSAAATWEEASAQY